MKKEFKFSKDRQVSIYRQELKLHEETQGFLFDLINMFTQEELDKLDTIEISEWQNVDRINIDNNNISLVISEYDVDVLETKSIENLSQIQQKVIIDTIILHFYKWN